MRITRRSFSRIACGGAIGLCTAGTSPTRLSPGWISSVDPEAGFGRLRADRRGILDLPKGFSYRIISRAGERMSDGFYVPGFPDGMAAYPGPSESVILLRNHEHRVGHPVSWGPFKRKKKLLNSVDPKFFYDTGGAAGPCLGSVTTLVYDPTKGKVLNQFLNLVGTLTNCSGGTTPWGTWISCEESCENRSEGFAKNHGYAFEVPVSADGSLTPPKRLAELGRFCHEGVVVHPKTGITYQTEDRPDSLLYRFIPDQPASLNSGRLQALAFVNKPRFDTRNWQNITASVGERFPVRWIDLSQVDSDEDNLRRRGWLRGAALFARGEGICLQGSHILFGCTTGGKANLGQIWRYHASPNEGTSLETENPAQLELFLESNSAEGLENPDQFSTTLWGDLMVCEDGKGPQHLVGVTPQGECYRFARNSRDLSELAGVCFSPDGATMFVNNLQAGLTFAVTGPWKKIL